MAKSARRAISQTKGKHNGEPTGAGPAGNRSRDNVHALPTRRAAAKWDPLDEAGEKRDHSYIRKVRPRSPNQERLMEALKTHNMVVTLGPPGTGKTYLAISAAVEALESGQVDRIILSRPAVEAGESLGFLPGDLAEKMAPYLRPLYDALTERMGGKRLRAALADGTIEIGSIAHMRGRTLSQSIVVVDEAQNLTYLQLKMLVTRLGWNSTMVITGDPDQCDLPEGMSGLSEMARRLEPLSDIAIICLENADIVRHPLVAAMMPHL
jgi:phosphate starvation-inducible PhoH-like protein